VCTYAPGPVTGVPALGWYDSEGISAAERMDQHIEYIKCFLVYRTFFFYSFLSCKGYSGQSAASAWTSVQVPNQVSVRPRGLKSYLNPDPADWQYILPCRPECFKLFANVYSGDLVYYCVLMAVKGCQQSVQFMPPCPLALSPLHLLSGLVVINTTSALYHHRELFSTVLTSVLYHCLNVFLYSYRS
jgi:hypothetical protein